MKQFKIVFDERNVSRIENMAARLGVKPDSMLCGFLLEKLTELERLKVEGKKHSKEYMHND